MLPKTQRLKTSDFKDFRGAAVLHTPHFLLRVKKALRFKAAAIVSAAVAKRAVDRNLLRRRVYAALKGRPSGFPAVLLTCTAKKGAVGLSYDGLRQELSGALQKIR